MARYYSVAARVQKLMVILLVALRSGQASTIRIVIDKFPFSSGGSATDVGNLLESKTSNTAGQSSTVSGYTSGGLPTTYQHRKVSFLD